MLDEGWSGGEGEDVGGFVSAPVERIQFVNLTAGDKAEGGYPLQSGMQSTEIFSSQKGQSWAY